MVAVGELVPPLPPVPVLVVVPQAAVIKVNASSARAARPSFRQPGCAWARIYMYVFLLPGLHIAGHFGSLRLLTSRSACAHVWQHIRGGVTACGPATLARRQGNHSGRWRHGMCSE